MVLLEHRYYGKSSPFESLSTENLRYLSSKQALFDLAIFRQYYQARRTNIITFKAFYLLKLIEPTSHFIEKSLNFVSKMLVGFFEPMLLLQQ